VHRRARRPERFFAEFGDPVPTRTSPAPELSDAERRDRLERAAAKAPEYGIEMLAPGQGQAIGAQT